MNRRGRRRCSWRLTRAVGHLCDYVGPMLLQVLVDLSKHTLVSLLSLHPFESYRKSREIFSLFLKILSLFYTNSMLCVMFFSLLYISDFRHPIVTVQEWLDWDAKVVFWAFNVLSALFINVIIKSFKNWGWFKDHCSSHYYMHMFTSIFHACVLIYAWMLHL